MNLLGIDYGRVYLGLALAKEQIPSALTVIKSKSDGHKLEEIVRICQKEDIEKIIIGGGSGKLENHIRGFITKLKEKVGCEVIVVDETLTSSIATDQMVDEGVPQKKRRDLGHAYAAVLLLKDYLNESNH